MPLRLGRKPNDPSKPRIKLAAHLNVANPPPDEAMWTSVPDWGMMLNDQLGCCTCAGDGHIAEILTYYGQGTETVITDAEALAAYEAVGHYDPNAGPPGNNPTDQGATVQDALGYLRKTGMAGVKLAAFAEVDPANLTEIRAACAELGPLSAGVNLPANALSQFQAGQVWDAVDDDGGIEGGHDIVWAGYDPQFIYFITWGKVQKATYAWWQKYGEEIWCVISADWVSAKGNDPEGVNLASLGAEFATLTGEPSPFTQPAPAPEPAPALPAHPHDFIRELLDDAHALIAKGEQWLADHVIHGDPAPPQPAPGAKYAITDPNELLADVGRLAREISASADRDIRELVDYLHSFGI